MGEKVWKGSKSKQIFWGLLHIATDKIVGYTTSSNEGDVTVETTYTLDHTEDNEWLVKDKYIAEYVRNFTIEYYNADYNTPENPYQPDELEVIRIIKEVTISKEVISIPDIETFVKDKFANERKELLEDALKGIKERKLKNKPYKYTLWDLNEFLLKNKIISESIFKHMGF